VKTRIIESLDHLGALHAAWSRLEHGAVVPMQHFIWAQACASAFTPETELRVLVVEEGHEPVAIAPLVHRKGSPCLEMLGVSELNEPADVVCAGGDAVQ